MELTSQPFLHSSNPNVPTTYGSRQPASLSPAGGRHRRGTLDFRQLGSRKSSACMKTERCRISSECPGNVAAVPNEQDWFSNHQHRSQHRKNVAAQDDTQTVQKGTTGCTSDNAQRKPVHEGLAAQDDVLELYKG
eukprot:scaffold314816_cov23-Tisochrysis_lutea.AAC.1